MDLQQLRLMPSFSAPRHITAQPNRTPLRAERIEREATALLHDVKNSLIVWHQRAEPPESSDAVIARLRGLAATEGVRLVVKRDLESGKGRYWRRR